MSESYVNLSNETEILKSRLLVQRVVKDLDLQTEYYYKGEVRSTLAYKTAPCRLEIVQAADEYQGFGFTINIVDNRSFTINKGNKVYYFGQNFEINGDTCRLIKTPQFFYQSNPSVPTQDPDSMEPSS